MNLDKYRLNSSGVLVYALLICLLIISPALAQQKAKGNDLVHVINPGPENPRNSEGAFIELKDGSILYVYSRFRGGNSSDHSPAQLVGRYSRDKGKTWTRDDQVIVDREGEMNVMSSSLLRLQNNDIALIYLRKNSLDDCMPQIKTSKDEGKTWSNSSEIIKDAKGYFVVNNDRVIQLKSGRLLVPVSLHKTSETKWSNKGMLRCYYSDDQGKSWKSGESVPSPDSIITQEPGVIELKDGRVMMFIRASGGEQYRSYSSDQGLSWTFAEPSGIQSPISPASMKRIPKTGDLILVWNNNGVKGPGYFSGQRSPLTVAISKDEGLSWNKVKNIETDPKGMFCYTAIQFTGKDVLLGYGVGAGLASSYIRRLSLSWIYK